MYFNAIVLFPVDGVSSIFPIIYLLCPSSFLSFDVHELKSSQVKQRVIKSIQEKKPEKNRFFSIVVVCCWLLATTNMKSEIYNFINFQTTVETTSWQRKWVERESFYAFVLYVFLFWGKGSIFLKHPTNKLFRVYIFHFFSLLFKIGSIKAKL